MDTIPHLNDLLQHKILVTGDTYIKLLGMQDPILTAVCGHVMALSSIKKQEKPPCPKCEYILNGEIKTRSVMRRLGW